ncbi:MAG TPA: ABC transporter ATP-binding protein [Thermoplasmata archaeon]|nr:ABC transporter ATP-binding protein [Thermoplasmata archaeon]
MNAVKSAPRIQLHGVGKAYGAADGAPLRALEGIELAIPPGDVLAVEGPSGCGKTTLLNLLGLLDVPTAGELRWNGERVDDQPERLRSRRRLADIGFVFQRFHLLPTLTSAENVELPMRAARVSTAVRRARALELLRRVGLEQRARAYPHQLSGGEEQRVALARALANRPRLLLADEPTGELDSANAARVMELLLELHRETGATLVIVTHNPTVAAVADHHLRLLDGRVADGGST